MSQKVSLIQRAGDGLQFFLCLGVVVLLLLYLTVWHGYSGHAYEEPEAVSTEADVYVNGQKSIVVRPDSPIFRKLHILTVNQAETTDPIVIVTDTNTT